MPWSSAEQQSQVHGGNPVTSLLNPGDDLTGVAKTIEDMWYIKSKIEVKEQTQSGTIIRRNWQYVQRGDFVDVRAVAYIQRSRYLSIRFGMEEIVILQKKCPVSRSTCCERC